jgi:hypothetical protein
MKLTCNTSMIQHASQKNPCHVEKLMRNISRLLGTSSPFAKPNICRLQAVSCKHALKATCVCGKIWDTTPCGLIAMLIGRIWKNDQKPWGFCGTLFSGKPILHSDRTIVFSGFL